MQFKFILDQNYILLKMINNRDKILELEEWKARVVSNIFNKEIVEEIENQKDRINEYFLRDDFKKVVEKYDLDLKIDKLKQDQLFNKYYEETLNYLNFLQREWSQKENKIVNWLEKTIKVTLTKKEIFVYVSHPMLNTGMCLDEKYIFWGHWLGLKDINYNITYLVHEALHIILPNENYRPLAMKLYHDKPDFLSNQEYWKILNNSIKDYDKILDFEYNIVHTVIELISDNELYTLLSSSSKYQVGHKYPSYSLVEYKECLLPYWFSYLNLSSQEIKRRVPNFTFQNDELLKEMDKQSIGNFINFLINNEQIRNIFSIPEIKDSNLKHNFSSLK